MKLVTCPIPGCWEKIRATQALCDACRSWWQRIRHMSPNELVEYIQKTGRWAGRHDYVKSKHKPKIRLQRAA